MANLNMNKRSSWNNLETIRIGVKGVQTLDNYQSNYN